MRVIRATDPLRTALVFSCGMGAVRTTFAMVAASLVRRKQFIARGIPDPYAVKCPPIATTPVITHGSGTNTVSWATVTLSITDTRFGASQRQGWILCHSTLIVADMLQQHTESLLVHALEQATAQQDLSKSLLRLTYLLQQSTSVR